MATSPQPTSKRVELRKYPNRRYYDATRSRHVTLEEIHALIRDGYEVKICDSKTGEDITAKVLAQIILEQDPPKLAIFPVDLLHQLIRANEPLIHDFVDKYFNQALRAFLESQRQFERYMRSALGLQASMPSSADWARMMMGPLGPVFFPPPVERNGAKRSEGPAKQPAAAGAESEEEVRQHLESLRQQVRTLQDEIERLRKVDT
jgi:polyhydroxyalkanoate synthesis repressor PhaR